MDLEIIREFLLLAESCNFQTASEHLTLSQSALSKHIHKLEEELELDLFDRSKRRVTLNENGQVFREYAREIYKLYDECIYEMKKRRSSSSNIIRVGTIRTQDRYDLMEMLTSYCATNPNIQMKMLEQDSNLVKADLTSGKVDFIFTADSEIFDGSDFVKLPVAKDRLVAVLPSDNPLAGKETLELSDLENERIIEHSSHYEQQLIAGMLEGSDLRLNIVASVSYSQALIKMAAQGMGIAIISEGCLGDISDYALKKVNLTGDCAFTVYLVYKNRKLPDEAERFVSVFTEGIRKE